MTLSNKLKTKLFAFLLLLCCCSNPKQLPNSFLAKVIGIKDGDTIEILEDQKPIIVRLADIDCPEKSQPFGTSAKKFTSDFCYGKEVTINSNGKFDRYKRLIATVIIANISLNRELIINGYAWHFKKYSHSKEFSELEEKARLNKVGLWADKNPTPPWDWRKHKTNLHFKAN